VQHRRVEVLEVQQDVVLLRAAAAPLADLDSIVIARLTTSREARSLACGA
jgi:hypothetical protein